MDALKPLGPAVDNEMSNPMEKKGLTRREIEVLKWAARGKANTEIGMILHISPRTASKHLEHVYIKLGVESRTAAVVMFLEVLEEVRHQEQSPRNFQHQSEFPPTSS